MYEELDTLWEEIQTNAKKLEHHCLAGHHDLAWVVYDLIDRDKVCACRWLESSKIQ